MDVNWIQVLIEGGVITAVIAIIEIVRDWHNKRGKDKTEVEKSKVEVKQTDYEAQKQGLDLVQEFYVKVKQVTEDQNMQLFKRLDKIENKQDKFESLQQDMVTYLNGDFAKWRDEHNRKEEING
ncbi:MAG: hypothetical protein II063_10360 [Prevotella sp.]|nr:hypothetical protein [Prevotella sp.]